MSQSNSYAQCADLQWPATETLIPVADASIFLMFHGLMCLAYNHTTGLLEAGIHRKAPDHNFKIYVIRFGQSLSDFSLVYSFEPKSQKQVPGGEIAVNISTPCDPGIQFYLPKVEDDYSWAQLLDLEGHEFYDCKLKKKTKALKPKITVDQGQFRVVATPYKFLRFEDGPLGTDIGTIDYCGLGLVRHEGVGTITISTKREELILPASKDKPLLVIFANACPRDTCPPGQNDFPLYYKTIKLKGNQKKFRLEPIRMSEQRMKLGDLSFLDSLFQHELFGKIFSSTDAPCGAAGYGRSVGIKDSAP